MEDCLFLIICVYTACACVYTFLCGVRYGILRALHMLGKHSVTEPHSQSGLFYFILIFYEMLLHLFCNHFLGVCVYTHVHTNVYV
jgi:hypothetical protein